jgi:hypothetical protein
MNGISSAYSIIVKMQVPGTFLDGKSISRAQVIFIAMCMGRG